MIVVFDTNIWLSELGLRSPAGAAARFFLHQKNARLALPEVVRLEIEHNLRSRLREFVNGIRDNHRQLLTAFGTLKEVVLPTESEIEAKIAEVFATVGVELLEIPFSVTSARSSFMKTIDKLPPSDKSQQFKDGVIWADCVALLEQDDVVLVCADKAFYQDRDYSKGIAVTLSAEASKAQHRLTLVQNLGALLSDIHTEVVADDELLASEFLRKNRDSIDGMLSRNGLQLGNRLKLTRDLYVTEKSGVLFLTFSMEYECEHVSGSQENHGALTLKGDGSYNTETRRFGELRNFGEELKIRFADGSEREVRNTVGFVAGIVIGHREISNTVRYKL